ncbi:hypothetical protein DL98DRAFT_590464 [Cadophora sp. DSE1049]|nr:hypothetical protein DL98DRAFT_590464 [Cadophora sp. DSE1049]
MSNFTVDQSKYEQDTSAFLCPRVRIIPDGDHILEDRHKCCLCWGTFAESAEDGSGGCLGGGPRILPCGHVFGKDCLKEALLTSRGVCPLCRARFQIRRTGKSIWEELRDEIRIEENPTACNVLKYNTFCGAFPTFELVEMTMGVGMRKPVNRSIGKLTLLVIYIFVWQLFMAVLAVAFFGPPMLLLWLADQIFYFLRIRYLLLALWLEIWVPYYRMVCILETKYYIRVTRYHALKALSQIVIWAVVRGYFPRGSSRRIYLERIMGFLRDGLGLKLD